MRKGQVHPLWRHGCSIFLFFLPQTLLSFSRAMSVSSRIASASPSLRETLRGLTSHDVFLLDGGTGEELFRRGVPDDRKIWSATAVVHSQHHQTLQTVHASFLQAGSQAVTTNSYGIVPGVGFHDHSKRKEFIAMAGRLARATVNENSDQGFVLGSIGPLIESYRADLILPHDAGVKEYQPAIEALEPYVDAFLAETMSCVEESLQVLDALSILRSSSGRDFSTSIPLMISYTLDSKGRLRDKQSVTDGLCQVIQSANEKDIELLAVLFNCSEPEAITIALSQIKTNPALQKMLNKSQIRLGAYANRLTAIDPNWNLESSESAQPFRNDLDESRYWNDFVQVWIRDLGVQLVGGCCGITPEHIAYIRSKLDSSTSI